MRMCMCMTEGPVISGVSLGVQLRVQLWIRLYGNALRVD